MLEIDALLRCLQFERLEKMCILNWSKNLQMEDAERRSYSFARLLYIYIYIYFPLWNCKWHELSWVIYEHSTRFGATNALLYDFTAGGTSYWWQLAFSFPLYTIAEHLWTLSRLVSDAVAISYAMELHYHLINDFALRFLFFFGQLVHFFLQIL